MKERSPTSSVDTTPVRPSHPLDLGNKTTVEFANQSGQIFHDSLPLGRIANKVLPIRDILGRHWDQDLSMGEEASACPEPMRVKRIVGSGSPASRNACRMRPVNAASGSFVLAAKEWCMATRRATLISNEIQIATEVQ